MYLYMAEMWINLRLNILSQEKWNNEPVCKVEVELSVEGHPEGSK